MRFSDAIIRWYHRHKRDLPWRNSKDPYKIWLSEIILQQTRVNQGLPYYETFVKKFPTVHHLANAKEDEVMKTWQGLGYYSRARNLHFTAKHISAELKGKFPDTFNEIKKLKGIGDYTAGAIASFAFNQPFPVVDGNVFRVLSRFYGIKTPIDSTKGKKEFTGKANLLIDKKNPGIFNQAIMEFGALQCVPQNPDCRKCPLKNNCKAYSKNLVDILPIKSQKTKIKIRYFNYFVFRVKGKIGIRKRTENDIWKNLYDFPMVETTKPVKRFPIFLNSIIPNERKKGMPEYWNDGIKTCKVELKHVLSHQIIYARFWEAKSLSGKKPVIVNNERYISESQLHKFAFPRLIERYFQGK